MRVIVQERPVAQMIVINVSALPAAHKEPFRDHFHTQFCASAAYLAVISSMLLRIDSLASPTTST